MTPLLAMPHGSLTATAQRDRFGCFQAVPLVSTSEAQRLPVVFENRLQKARGVGYVAIHSQ